MRTYPVLFTTVSFLASATAVFAAATQQEADRIKAGFEKVLSATPGLVTVMVAGEGYDVTLDVAPLIAKSSAKMSVSPMHFKLMPLGNGKWQMDQNEPLSASIKQGDAFDMEYKLGVLQQTGVFDENVGWFVSGGFEVRDYTTTQSILDPATKVPTNSSSTIRLMKGTSTATPGKNGGLDVVGSYETTGFSANMEIPTPGSTSTTKIDYSGRSPLSKYTATGLRTKELLELIAWFVAHPSEQAVKSGQAEMKTLFKAALPLWESVQSSSEIADIKIKTPYGDAAISAVNFIADVNGLTKDGKFREALEFKGVTIPTAAFPAWTHNLIPKDVSVDFTVTGFDAATVTALALDALDLNNTPPLPEALVPQLLTTALPTGKVNIALNPGSIVAPSYTLSYEGVLNAGPSGIPTGNAKLRMKGFDATLKAMQEAAATDPSVQQAIGPLMVIKGFAKIEGEELVWGIESNGSGGILVNGVDVTKM